MKLEQERKLHKITFYGKLATDYTSDPIEIYAKNTKDLFKGLVSRFGEKFKQTILNGSWYIAKGKKKFKSIEEAVNFIDTTEIEFPINDELHLFPKIMGSGGNLGRIILGAVLIIVGIVLIFTPFSAFSAPLIIAGIGAIAGGVIGLLTKNPTFNNFQDTTGPVEARPSFLFNGPINNTEQGVPVQLVYGETLVGSTIINTAITTYQT